MVTGAEGSLVGKYTGNHVTCTVRHLKTIHQGDARSRPYLCCRLSVSSSLLWVSQPILKNEEQSIVPNPFWYENPVLGVNYFIGLHLAF